jgi:inorganic triphosphatase YgiF
MEIELKYRVDSGAQAGDILSDGLITAIEEPGSRCTVPVRAVYFDTEDLILSKNMIAFRIRKEGDRLVGTLKWGGNDELEYGLYEREEANVPLADESQFEMPDPGIFKETEIGETLTKLIAGKPLIGLFETVFTRTSLRIDSGESICEVAVDTGEIIAKGRSERISEIEVELFTGSKESLINIGERIKEKYGLKPERRSKYRRGLDLCISIS